MKTDKEKKEEQADKGEETLNPKLGLLALVFFILTLKLLFMAILTGCAFFHLHKPGEDIFSQNVFWAAVFFGISAIASLILAKKLMDESREQAGAKDIVYSTPDVCIWFGLLVATLDPAIGFLLEHLFRIFSTFYNPIQPGDGFVIGALFFFPCLFGAGTFIYGLMEKY